MRMRSSSLLLLVLAFLGQCIIYTQQVQSRCPVVRLTNGRVRARAKGRIIRFTCYDGFTLVGDKYSTCIRGQWDTPTPVCVNAECPALPTPEHALTAPEYNGAILIYFCEPGYVLIGPSEIYCDGRQWNGTAPYCRDTSATAPTQCDFEKPDLCWWEQDPQHDFDWRRHNFETPSSHIGTGPTHDHTLGPGNDGYYLYIEASGRLVNDTARIISPLYNASYTEAGCFSFWYHMFGATVGALRVYFKAETNGTMQLMFTKQGDQGNQWLNGVFNLPRAEKGFQIIIEGVRGSSYVSDIAVDDVAILQGDKCNGSKIETTGVTPSNEDQIEQVNAQQSCRGRCKNTVAYNFSTTPFSRLGACLCTLDCAELSMCCPDYAEYCVLAYTEDVSVEPTEVTNTIHDLVAPSVTPLRNKSDISDVVTVRSDYFNKNGISIIPKDDIDPTMTKPAVFTTNTPITNVTRMRTERPIQTTRRTTLPTVPTKETPFAVITTVTRRYIQQHDQPDSETRIQDPKKLHRGSTKFSLPGIIGIVTGILTGVSITMLVAFVLVRKRKSYKRGTNGSALSEDSDVRFLTSDEILDFTLARPNDNDEA